MKTDSSPASGRPTTPGGSAEAFGAAMGEMLKKMTGVSWPLGSVNTLQADYLKQATELWNQSVQALAQGAAAATAPSDRRFSATEWAASPHTAYAAQMYLLNARTLLHMADSVQADEKTRARIRFAVQQWIDAAAPSNFLATNPEALAKALKTGGESIAQGLNHLWQDVQRGHVSQTDETVFEVGRNVATTEGWRKRKQ